VGDRRRVLVVDDVPSVRLLLKSTLPLHGLEVVGEASTGVDALTLAKSEKPDVVLLDIHMPDMNGMEVIQQLKADFPAVKIVMYSNYDDRNMQQQAYSLGADAYVDKLAPIPDVANAIQALFADGDV
jgi:DNA-binding NarL/FixJ family response regulator